MALLCLASAAFVVALPADDSRLRAFRLKCQHKKHHFAADKEEALLFDFLLRVARARLELQSAQRELQESLSQRSLLNEDGGKEWQEDYQMRPSG